MKALIKLCKQTIALPKIADKLFMVGVKEHVDKIRSLNLHQLYEEGVNSEGVLIGHYSNVSLYLKSIADRYGRDSRSDHITLKDTGDFYASFQVIILKTGFKIRADDEKNGNNLQDAYPKIIGLTAESKTILAGLILPNLIKDIRTEILG